MEFQRIHLEMYNDIVASNPQLDHETLLSLLAEKSTLPQKVSRPPVDLKAVGQSSRSKPAATFKSRK